MVAVSAPVVFERRWWALPVLLLSLMVVNIDTMVLNVALPTLVRDLHATTSQLEWIVDSYILLVAGLLLTAGSLGDRFGRRGALDAGLVLFGVASAAGAWASSATQLIACRALMGVGAALIMPATLSLLTNIFTNPIERGRAIGVWTATSGIGVAVGPVVGGLLLGRFWWGSVFLVNIPIVVVAVVASRFLVPTSKDPSARKLDLVGALLSIAAFSALLWAIIGAPERGWSDAVTLAFFGIGALVLGGFIVWELHSDHPMLDLSFFRNPRFTVAIFAIGMSGFAMTGEIFVLTQLLQFVMGFSPLEAGLRVAPWSIVLIVIGPLSPLFAERLGSKAAVTCGLGISAFGMTLFALTGVGSSYWYVLAAIMTVAAGSALAMAPATESIMGAIPRARAGAGSAVNNVTRQLCGALGVAVIGGLYASGYRSSLNAHAPGLGLTGQALTTARKSVGSVLKLAADIGGRPGAEITAAAKSAFIHGLHLGIGLAAVMCLAGAALAFGFLPARAPEQDAAGYLPAELIIDPNELDGALAVE